MTSGEYTCFQACWVHLLEGRVKGGNSTLETPVLLANTLSSGIILWWSGGRVYPAIFWYSYFYFSVVSEAFANTVTLSAYFTALIKKLLLVSCFEATQLPLKLPNWRICKSSQETSCFSLQLCIQLLPLALSIFFALRSCVTREFNSLFFSMPLSTTETIGMIVVSSIGGKLVLEVCFSRLLNWVFALSYKTEWKFQDGWRSKQ